MLRRAEPIAALLGALDGVERLVLLGDLAELVTRTPRRSLAVAEPVLRAIGQRMAGREVIVVPGNHDGPLIRSWIHAQGQNLTVDAEVAADATGALARIVSWLRPADVRIHYPGVWLGDRIYATHGHYLDHHLIPESPVGLPRGRLDPRSNRLATPHDYERGRIRSHHRRDSRLVQRPLMAAADTAADLARTRLLPHVPGLLLNARLTPVSAAIVDLQMRRAALPAIARVINRLGIDAEWVVFGHVHRLGPLGDDRRAAWQPRDAGPRIVNSGSWLYEPALIDRASPPHPYWPGGAVIIEPGGDPRAVGLLDHVDERAVRAGRQRARRARIR